MLSAISLTFPSDSLKQSISTNDNYFGGWPYNENKNLIKGNDIDIICPYNIGCECISDSDCINDNCKQYPKGSWCMPKNGDIFPNFTAIDQYEEEVQLYDFANNNKYIFIEMSATWCSPCHILSDWLSNDSKNIINQRWWKDEYQMIKELINNNEIFFITILYEDNNRDKVSYQTLYEWFDMYPDSNIPILADSDKLLHSWIKPTGIPAITLLDENMTILSFSSRGINVAFDKFLNIHYND